ncbi:MAG: DUF2877 domain-containing protein [Thermoleophilia bacterium]|nr:DUF2877 domain-containing protein [Thermoleophilia bacterium]
MRAVLAGPAARRALTGDRAGAVEVPLRRGAYVRLGDEMVMVVPHRAPVGPLTLLVAGIGAPGWAEGTPARVDGGRLVVGGDAIEVAGVPAWDGRAPGPLRDGWRGALRAAVSTVPVPDAALRPGLDALAAGDLDAGIARLAGRGEGLTPAGDDVLCGFAGWRHARGDPVAVAEAAAPRTSPVSLAYLRCAERGELPEAAALVLAAIRAGAAPLAARRAQALRAWGATSGSALLWGMAAVAA